MELDDDWVVIEKLEIVDSKHPKDVWFYFTTTNFWNQILIIVFNLLETEDLCRIACVCKHWNRVSLLDSVWKDRFVNDFKTIPKNDCNIKTQYLQKKYHFQLFGSGNAISLHLDSDVFISSVPTKFSGRILLRFIISNSLSHYSDYQKKLQLTASFFTLLQLKQATYVPKTTLHSVHHTNTGISTKQSKDKKTGQTAHLKHSL